MHAVITGHDILPELPGHLASVGLEGRAFIMSDETVLELHGAPLTRILGDHGWEAHARAVPPGEASKSLRCASDLWDWLVVHQAERRDVVLALGGGVVGDLAGWVAATYLRGMHLVQLPTTLLAQVDSSIGGKTGIDHARGKNLIGSFYPPDLTFIDTAFLETLPARELRSGLAEAIKTALIADADLFGFIQEHVPELLRVEPSAIQHVVDRCARIKLDVVTQDPKESGRRMILNYGHTIGHAVEASSGYGALLHGEAVAIGMHAAAYIAVQMGLLRPDVMDAQDRLIEAFGLPLTASGLGAEQVLETMKLDKKVRAGQQRWVLLRDIGNPEVRPNVPTELVRRAVEEATR